MTARPPQALLDTLGRYRQQHLLRWWDELEADNRESLVAQIEAVDLEKIAPFAVNAQIKVAVSPNRKKQEADFPRIVNILKAADYRGYVVLEYEDQKEPKKAIPRYISELREVIHA